jgi:hypothetical protein
VVHLREETRERFTLFQRGTLLALGLLAFALLYGLIRSRVEAHHDRLVVVNGYRRREYAWAQMAARELRRLVATLSTPDG